MVIKVQIKLPKTAQLQNGVSQAMSSHLNGTRSTTAAALVQRPAPGNHRAAFKKKQKFLDLLENHKIKQRQQALSFREQMDQAESEREKALVEEDYYRQKKQMF